MGVHAAAVPKLPNSWPSMTACSGDGAWMVHSFMCMGLMSQDGMGPTIYYAF
jgi:hypothetical protein